MASEKMLLESVKDAAAAVATNADTSNDRPMPILYISSPGAFGFGELKITTFVEPNTKSISAKSHPYIPYGFCGDDF